MLLAVVQSILYEALSIYRYIVFGAIIASWVAPGSSHPLVQFLYRVTEPVLAPIRKVLPDLGGIDVSPIVLLLGIHLLQRLL
jgi:YggT family protein